MEYTRGANSRLVDITDMERITNKEYMRRSAPILFIDRAGSFIAAFDIKGSVLIDSGKTNWLAVAEPPLTRY